MFASYSGLYSEIYRFEYWGNSLQMNYPGKPEKLQWLGMDIWVGRGMGGEGRNGQEHCLLDNGMFREAR